MLQVTRDSAFQRYAKKPAPPNFHITIHTLPPPPPPQIIPYVWAACACISVSSHSAYILSTERKYHNRHRHPWCKPGTYKLGRGCVCVFWSHDQISHWKHEFKFYNLTYLYNIICLKTIQVLLVASLFFNPLFSAYGSVSVLCPHLQQLETPLIPPAGL